MCLLLIFLIFYLFIYFLFIYLLLFFFNRETNSNLSDHLSSSTDNNLTSNFAPAGKYSHSNHSSSVSDNTESDKESEISNPFIDTRDRK